MRCDRSFFCRGFLCPARAIEWSLERHFRKLNGRRDRACYHLHSAPDDFLDGIRQRRAIALQMFGLATRQRI